ncbi:MAG: hypothetical protein WCJ33_04110 [Pseudomonadota bacterium]
MSIDDEFKASFNNKDFSGNLNDTKDSLQSLIDYTDRFNQKLLDNNKISNTTIGNLGKLFDSFQSSSDKAIKNILLGTQNWHQATSTIIADLEIKFAQMLVRNLTSSIAARGKDLFDAVSSDQIKISSNQAKNAAIKAGDQETSDAGIAAHAAQIIKQIKSDAAATYAGVYAFMSPVLGPAAAIPAGISAASVAAMEGLISLDVGAWNLNSDTVAQLHQGEMVVPKTFAQGLRENGGVTSGAGDNYTININAIDTQTGAQFIKNNASHIASAIAGQARNFNSNVPSWKV